MIRVFTGLPGAGKSYAATEDATQELTKGFRTVFHNMEMNHGEMAVYLRDRGYEPDMAIRIRKIPEARLKDFWAYANEQSVTSARLFIIDEAHVFFDSRGWAETGPIMSVYLTQHRHLNDEILFITQHPDMLDKRIRLLVAETTQFRNLRTEKWLQWFRPPAWMVWSQFHGLPRFGQKPQAIGRKKLDLALAKCYKTSVGHGGMGRSGGPEKDRATKRLNWKWMLLPAAALLYLVNVGPELMLKWGIGKSINALSDATKPQTQHQTPKPQQPHAQVDPGQPFHPKPVPSATEEPRAPVAVKGYVSDGKGLRILLDDGRTITEEDRPYRKAGRLYWSTGESANWAR